MKRVLRAEGHRQQRSPLDDDQEEEDDKHTKEEILKAFRHLNGDDDDGDTLANLRRSTATGNRTLGAGQRPHDRSHQNGGHNVGWQAENTRAETGGALLPDVNAR